MHTTKRELLEESSEILYRANKINALFYTIKNSIQYSIEFDENLAYILTSIEMCEKMLNDLIYLADAHERRIL